MAGFARLAVDGDLNADLRVGAKVVAKDLYFGPTVPWKDGWVDRGHGRVGFHLRVHGQRGRGLREGSDFALHLDRRPVVLDGGPLGVPLGLQLQVVQLDDRARCGAGRPGRGQVGDRKEQDDDRGKGRSSHHVFLSNPKYNT